MFNLFVRTVRIDILADYLPLQTQFDFYVMFLSLFQVSGYNNAKRTTHCSGNHVSSQRMAHIMETVLCGMLSITELDKINHSPLVIS